MKTTHHKTITRIICNDITGAFFSFLTNISQSKTLNNETKINSNSQSKKSVKKTHTESISKGIKEKKVITQQTNKVISKFTFRKNFKVIATKNTENKIDTNFAEPDNIYQFKEMDLPYYMYGKQLIASKNQLDFKNSFQFILTDYKRSEGISNKNTVLTSTKARKTSVSLGVYYNNNFVNNASNGAK